MRERSSSSAEIRVYKLDYDLVLKKVREYAEDLVRRGLAELVVLIGSLAKGDYSPSSDIDLLIVVRDAPKNPLERISAYINSKLPLDVEPRVMTIEEFFKVARERRRLSEEALFRGVFLAGNKELLEEVKRAYGRERGQDPLRPS
ncbi:MAG: nucleotidyltransferase domain-containing protein [Candidatus Verstraetearchaeota archaeon]|nr:nucleotidyltransferase domain-containing protein [Candidatus Verstraetearchaeota archaeon]